MESVCNWNCEMEVNLFHALRGHKPVGVNRHFQMIFIHEKLADLYKKITAKQIWEFLGKLYDLNALNESEILPFPNKEADFDLPSSEFGDLFEKSFPRQSPAPKPQSKQEEPKVEIKTEKSEKSDKTEKSDKHEKRDKDKSEKSDKHDKGDKRDKHDRSDSGSSKSSKSEHRHSSGKMQTPDNSPKRKRTRHTPSTASPATPDAPPTKRRR